MGAMVVLGLLILCLLLFGLFIWLEFVEMALGAFVAVVVLGAVAFAFQLAAVMTILALVVLAMLVGIGYLVWRAFGSRPPSGKAEPQP